MAPLSEYRDAKCIRLTGILIVHSVDRTPFLAFEFATHENPSHLRIQCQ